MRIDIISLFPEMFSVVGELGVTGRAQRLGLWSMHVWNPRDYTHDVHRTVDDRPYGGGPGMVMLAEPLEKALDNALAARASAGAISVASSHSQQVSHTETGTDTPVILMSPAGQRFDQHMAQQLADSPGAVFVCGRYEGLDQRFIDRRVTHEISLGDFVLSGGEIAAMACIDAAVRLLPGALNDDDSARQDSFNEATSGLLDSPHYTRPEVHHGLEVPGILRSGHHANISAWRREQSLALTAARRPDLIEQARRAGRLSKKDEAFLRSLGADKSE
ncbi:tRNA (guanosine(37)-N1)-methyltransferase TrmD [Achromobacter sp. F4_2707]|uniref:tRNA (guanosine(37)-N1)-methyltransferase TrmD n=1 Tax=Achromobacter sp. F4_2707 TaxID=3114286 RepID=UPI0039C5C131